MNPASYGFSPTWMQKSVRTPKIHQGRGVGDRGGMGDTDPVARFFVSSGPQLGVTAQQSYSLTQGLAALRFMVRGSKERGEVMLSRLALRFLENLWQMFAREPEVSRV